MCMVSAITGWGQQQWPYTLPETKLPDIKEWIGFQEIVEKARKWDEANKQPDCVDPAKEKWLKELDALIKRRPSDGS